MIKKHTYLDYEKKLEYQRKYNVEHKEEYSEYKKNWYEQNKERILVFRKEYYEENKERVKERVRKRAQQRRDDFLKDKSCVVCGSTEKLEVDHVVPSKNNQGVNWSASLQKLQIELLKCQVLCQQHHREKSLRNGDYGKLTQDQANEIKKLIAQGMKQKEIAKQFGISQANVSMIKLGKTWK